MAGWSEETRAWLWRMRFADFLSTRRHVTLMGGDYTSALRYVSDERPNPVIIHPENKFSGHSEDTISGGKKVYFRQVKLKGNGEG